MSDADDEVAATRRSYDEGAARYVDGIGTVIGPATETPQDQSILARFGDSVAGEAGIPRIGDVGCGPGRAGAFLRRLHPRLEVIGVDLSLALLWAARLAHPGVPFTQGVLARLPVQTAALGGVVSWYSIIHTAPDRLGPIAAELGRVIGPGGFVLVAFQAGEGDAAPGRSAPTYRHDPDAVGGALAEVGLHIIERTVRPAELEHETAPQAFVMARRRLAGSRTTRRSHNPV